MFIRIVICIALYAYVSNNIHVVNKKMSFVEWILSTNLLNGIFPSC